MAQDPNCIFCKIVAGEIPSQKVFESEAVVAFLDIGPLAEGHLLVVPREHYVTLLEMPEEVASALFACVPRLARAVQLATGTEACNVLQNNGAAAGQVVQHVHVHIIPRRPGDGLGYRWNAGQYGPGQAEAVCSRLRDALAKV